MVVIDRIKSYQFNQVQQYVLALHVMPHRAITQPNRNYMLYVNNYLKSSHCIQSCTCINCIQTSKSNTCTPTVFSDHTVRILPESHTPTQNIYTNVVKSLKLLQSKADIHVQVLSVYMQGVQYKCMMYQIVFPEEREEWPHIHKGNRADIEI